MRKPPSFRHLALASFYEDCARGTAVLNLQHSSDLGLTEPWVNVPVPDANYDQMKPVASSLVELGEQRTRQIQRGKRGREPVPFTPFPEAAMNDGHTTVLRGWVEVPHEGHYEFLAGDDESAFNVTEVNGVQAYRRVPGQAEPTLSPVPLKPDTRHPFRTIFCKKPGKPSASRCSTNPAHSPP